MLKIIKIMKLQERILEQIRLYGPSTPVDIAQRTKENSIIITAILEDLVRQGMLLKAKKKFGSLEIYYLPHQKNALRRVLMERIYNEIEKHLLQKIEARGYIHESELSNEEKEAIYGLADFVEKEGEFWKLIGFKIPEEIRKPQIKAEPEVKREVKQARFVDTKKEKEKVKVKSTKDVKQIKVKILDWLKEKGVEILKEEEVRKNVYKLIADVPTAFGRQKYYIFIKIKRKVAYQDMADILNICITEKIPIVVITTGEFSKSAKEFHRRNLGEMVKLIELKDIESEGKQKTLLDNTVTN